MIHDGKGRTYHPVYKTKPFATRMKKRLCPDDKGAWVEKIVVYGPNENVANSRSLSPK